MVTCSTAVAVLVSCAPTPFCVCLSLVSCFPGSPAIYLPSVLLPCHQPPAQVSDPMLQPLDCGPYLQPPAQSHLHDRPPEQLCLSVRPPAQPPKGFGFRHQPLAYVLEVFTFKSGLLCCCQSAQPPGRPPECSYQLHLPSGRPPERPHSSSLLPGRLLEMFYSFAWFLLLSLVFVKLSAQFACFCVLVLVFFQKRKIVAFGPGCMLSPAFRSTCSDTYSIFDIMTLWQCVFCTHPACISLLVNGTPIYSSW